MNTQTVAGYRLIVGYLGVMMMILGVILLLPLLVLLAYPQEIHEAKYFIIPSVSVLFIGYFLAAQIRDKEKGKLLKNQDAIIVTGAWMLAIIVSAMPFVLTGNYNFTQAIFETSSAWSTTGLSVVDVEATSHVFLMYRSILLFFGGVGLVLIMLSVLSDTYGMRLYHAEGHADKLLPNLIRSTRIIVSMYSGYILCGMALYILFGMNWFDALNHSIAALSTGGFSTHAASIGYYDSVEIELITMTLMLLGQTNFLAHLFLLKGKFKNFFRYSENQFSLMILGLFIPAIAFIFFYSGSMAMPEAFRVAAFQAISALTTTGFQTVSSFVNLPQSILLLMILLMLIGGGSGSTAGGIKQIRITILLKNIYWTLQSRFTGNRVFQAHFIQRVEKKERIQPLEITEAGTYFFTYLLVFFLGTFILTLYGADLTSAMFEFSSALSTVGLSMGIMTYDAPSVVLWVGSIGMILGRLEIYVFFIALYRGSLDLKNKLNSLVKH